MNKEIKTHELKTWPEYYAKIITGEKTYELRKNDRDFKEGDTLILKEWYPDGFDGKYTGRQTEVTVTYLFNGAAFDLDFGIQKGYCIMSITPVVSDKQGEESAEYGTVKEM